MSVVHEQLKGSHALLDAEEVGTRLMKPDVSSSMAVIDPTTPMGMIAYAAQRGATIEQMAQLWDLKLRVDADESKKAFNRAFSAFKSEAVRVVKNAIVGDGPLKGKRYADLFGVVSVVTPVLSKHYLGHSWKLTKDEPVWMEVTCIISHELGHSESVSMGAAPDTGPGRNAIQARLSTISYLERITLLAATGLAAADSDTDGNMPAGKGMDQEEFQRLSDLIETAETIETLKSKYLAACKDAGTDQGAIKAFAKIKDARYKELHANR